MLGSGMKTSPMPASQLWNNLKRPFSEDGVFIWKTISVPLKILKRIKKIEDETIKDFQDRFEDILYQIPLSHHPKEKYLFYLYTHALLVHLGFPLSKRGPRILNEAHSMDARIDKNISLSKIQYLFTSGTLSMEIVVALNNFIVNFQEERKQTIDRHRTTEDMVEKLESKKNDEVSTSAPPYDESIHEPFPTTQQEDNEVSLFPF